MPNVVLALGLPIFTLLPSFFQAPGLQTGMSPVLLQVRVCKQVIPRKSTVQYYKWQQAVNDSKLN